MARSAASWGAFLRLWVVIVFSYAPLKLIYDLVAGGYVDLRGASLAGLVVLPSAQTVVVWLITRRGRSQSGPPAATT